MRDLKSSITAMSTQVLRHLRTNLRENALLLGEKDLSTTTEIRFDTIPRIALEATRRAYISILEDPVQLEALKKELER